MNFFRNPEIKRNIFFYLMLTISVVFVGFVLGTSEGVLAICLSLVFDTAHFTVTYARYHKIYEISREIDRILHGQELLNLNEYGEGELAILQNEVYKMTVCMREQSDVLQRDKTYLADSIADISHQIRTPLTSINLIVSFLSRSEIDEERRIKLTKELEKLLSRIDWLISSLLKISRLDAETASFKTEKVSVLELIKRAVEPIAIPMELREQQLNINASGDETFIGDLSWSTEALGNILKNCMEHTPNGGKINIATAENAVFTEIVVTDNGCGIDADDLPHLFERFYKGKNSSDQSFGIGLALARMIVKAQNGTVKAENDPAGGAKFTIRFYKGVV